MFKKSKKKFTFKGINRVNLGRFQYFFLRHHFENLIFNRFSEKNLYSLRKKNFFGHFNKGHPYMGSF